MARKNPTQNTIRNEFVRVGERLSDGTVVIHVDAKKNIALFSPQEIFAGEATFDCMKEVAKTANDEGLHGYTDWHIATEEEAAIIAEVWNKVAPVARLKDRCSPWFRSKAGHGNFTSVKKSSEKEKMYMGRGVLLPVPIVRSGKALVSDAGLNKCIKLI